MAFWVWYDHLGLYVGLNLLWGVAVLGPVALVVSVPQVPLPALVLIPLAVAWGSAGFACALAHVTKEIIERRDAGFGVALEGIRRHGLRGLGVGTVLCAGGAAAAFGVVTYPALFGEAYALVGYALAAVSLWMVLAVAVTGLYAFPALVQKKAGVLATLRLAALLALAHPVFSAGLGVVVLAIALPGLAPVIGITLSGSVILVVVSCAYEMLARDVALRTGSATATYPPADGDDDYLNRTLRDALFPWKG